MILSVVENREGKNNEKNCPGCALCFIGAALHSAAWADGREGSTYVGLNYELLSYDEKGTTGEYDMSALAFKAGYFFTNSWAIEAKLGLGVSDGSDMEDILGTPVDVSVGLDNYFSLLFVGNYQANEKLSLYGKFGFSRVSMDFEAEALGWGYSEWSDSGSSLSLYGGLEYLAKPDFGFNVELGALYARDDISVGGINFGLTKYF